MEHNTNFQQNANVISSDGKEVGNLSRVVMRPDSKEVTHIVVKMKAVLNPDERIVPIETIETTTDGKILLSWSAKDVQNSPLFEEERLIPDNTSGPVIPPQSQSPAGDNLPIGFPAATPPGAGKFHEENVQNIREGSIALSEGAKVFSFEGNVIGRLESVVANLPGDMATHLVIAKGLLGGTKRMIPITWVKTMSEDEIHLRVKEETVDEVTKSPDETDL